ncbi:MAG: methylamine dehydrogenase (amicyanin) light chain, partial [Gammaproteobacteria bacterium]|nr:methylamine dehydrogenase (amicyanin) light chain [Gammaproteobacteria bacterium]
MYWLDKITEKFSRQVANSTSRRHLLKRIGLTLAGGAAVPLLPVARAADTGGGSGYHGVAPQTSDNPAADPGDPASCDYWRYCAVDGFLCSCCGGTHVSCP